MIFSKRVLLVTITTALFFVSPLVRAGEVFTKGDIDCGKWLGARNVNRAENLETFVLGFLNGYAVGTNLDIWRVGENPISPEQAYVWLDNYCKENPLSAPLQGVHSLFEKIFSN